MPHRHESLGLRQQSSARSQMQREYCAEVAQADGEPMAGTADVVDVWIMLEYLPAWTAKATTDNALAAPTKAWLKRLADEVAARGLKPRLQLIRRPETRSHRRDADARHGARIASAADCGLRRARCVVARSDRSRAARNRAAVFRVHQRPARRVLRAFRIADVRCTARAGWQIARGRPPTSADIGSRLTFLLCRKRHFTVVCNRPTWANSSMPWKAIALRRSGCADARATRRKCRRPKPRSQRAASTHRVSRIDDRSTEAAIALRSVRTPLRLRRARSGRC